MGLPKVLFANLRQTMNLKVQVYVVMGQSCPNHEKVFDEVFCWMGHYSDASGLEGLVHIDSKVSSIHAHIHNVLF